MQNTADPAEQLRLAVIAVFDSWNSSRADKYRSINQITGLKGTAVNIQAMVFGNMGVNSGTGVLFTRNPSTGEKKLYGEYLINAQVILNSAINTHWSPIELMSPESKLSMKMVESFERSVFLVRCILSSQKMNSHVVRQTEDSSLITNRVHATWINDQWRQILWAICSPLNFF